MIYDSRMTVAYIWKKADILIFRPSFFLGNLGRVDYITEYEYDLFIRPDTCNPRFRVWFNFTVENVKQDQVFCFGFCFGWMSLLSSKQWADVFLLLSKTSLCSFFRESYLILWTSVKLSPCIGMECRHWWNRQADKNGSYLMKWSFDMYIFQ